MPAPVIDWSVNPGPVGGQVRAVDAALDRIVIAAESMIPSAVVLRLKGLRRDFRSARADAADVASDPAPFFAGETPAGIDWPNHPDPGRRWREVDGEFRRASECLDDLASAFVRRPGIAARWADLAIELDAIWAEVVAIIITADRPPTSQRAWHRPRREHPVLMTWPEVDGAIADYLARQPIMPVITRAARQSTRQAKRINPVRYQG